MDLQQLEYFIAIAKHKNFTTAAKEFFISQPCISHQIKVLEEELGVELFTRNTRNVELTDEGEIFLKDASRAVDILKSSQYKLQHNNESRMKLTISYLAAATRHFLPDMIHEFKKLYPNVKVILSRKDATQIYHDMQNKNCDIYYSLIQDLTMSNELMTKAIQTDRYCLVTPKNHPVTQTMALDYEMLSNEPFVFMDSSKAVTMHNQVMGICAQMGFSPNIVCTYPLYEDILFAIESGIGISILPYHSKEYMVNSNLTYTLLDSTDTSIALALGWHKNTDNPAVELFLETFRNYMNEHAELFV